MYTAYNIDIDICIQYICNAHNHTLLSDGFMNVLNLVYPQEESPKSPQIYIYQKAVLAYYCGEC